MDNLCKKCNKVFSRNSSLIRHQKNNPNCIILKFKCNDCNKKFKFKSQLTIHKDRKTPCKLIIDDPTTIKNVKNQCHFCYRTYSTIYSLKKHIFICKVKNTEKGMQLLNDVIKEKEFKKIKTLKNNIEQQQEIIDELLNKLKNIEINKTTITHVENQHNNVNIVNNITINNYMNPNIKDILNSDRILEFIKKSAERAPLDIVTSIWFNPDYPENHSIYLVNKKTNEVLIYDNKWESSNCKIVIPKIREKVYKVMNDFDIKTINDGDKNLINTVIFRNSFIEYNTEDNKLIKELFLNKRKIIKRPLMPSEDLNFDNLN